MATTYWTDGAPGVGTEISAANLNKVVMGDSVVNTGNVYLAQTSGNKVLIGGAGGITPDQTLHVWRGSAGSVSAYSGDGVVIEDDASVFLGFLTPNTSSSGLHCGDPDSNVVGQFIYDHSLDAWRWYTSGTEKVRLTTDGAIFIGDTANANMMQGLTINQNANDDQIFCLKSAGDVATALTTGTVNFDVETDDFLAIQKVAATAGGAIIQVMAESTQASTFYIESYGGAPATTDVSTSLGAQNFFVAEHDGANGLNDMAADSNGFAWGEIDSGGTRNTRMILKADDGELHIGNSGTPVALDSEDDIMLVRSLQYLSSGGNGIKWTPFDEGGLADHERLMQLGIVGKKDEKGFYFSRLQPYLRLHDGAIWQLYIKHQDLYAEFMAEREARLALEQKVLALTRGN